MRIMGLDYGSKTVGVAVCDPLGITAQAVETITRKDENKLRQTLARIEALAKEYGVEKHMSETVTGYIDHVIFRNEDNGYTVPAVSFPEFHEQSPQSGL